MARRTPTPQDVLADWARAHGIRPIDLTREADLSYKQAWKLLKRQTPVTYGIIGRLLVAYGPEGPALALAAAMRRAHLAAQATRWQGVGRLRPGE